MQRRRSGEPTKVQRGGPKPRKAPASHVSTADLQEQVAALTRELKEAREQQTATTEVLNVIAGSTGELESVFQAMLVNAARVCEAKFGMLFRLENGAMRPLASLGVPEPLVEFFQRGPRRPHQDAPIMRAARTKQPAHVVDFTAERAYIERDPGFAC